MEVSDAERFFRAADTNNDGVIDLDEWTALQQQQQQRQPAVSPPAGPLPTALAIPSVSAPASPHLFEGATEEEVQRWVDTRPGFETMGIGEKLIQEGFGLYAAFTTLSEAMLECLIAFMCTHAPALP